MPKEEERKEGETLRTKPLTDILLHSFSVEMSPINLNRIQEWINAGRLDPTQPITMRELNKSNCLHGVKDGVKLLARGKDELKTPINIVVSRASAEAIAAVEKLGGTVTTRFYTPFAIRKIMGHAMAQGDALTFARADAEFHTLLIQVAGNRMLEHLSGIVSAALQVSGGPIAGCDRPTEASLTHHARIVDALAEGDGAGAEVAMRQLLTTHPEVERVVPAPREH